MDGHTLGFLLHFLTLLEKSRLETPTFVYEKNDGVGKSLEQTPEICYAPVRGAEHSAHSEIIRSGRNSSLVLTLF